MGAGVSVLSFLEQSPRFLSRDALMKMLSPLNGSKNVTVENEVDKQLKKAKEDDKYKHKILLLGRGGGEEHCFEADKGNQQDSADEGRNSSVYGKYSSKFVVEAIQTLLLVAGELGDELGNPELMGDVERILSIDLCDAADELTPELGKCISRMWKDSGVQETYLKREFFHLMDSTDYYLDEIERIAQSNYVPTEEDTIMTRVRTTGMVTSDIKDGPFTYQIVDVGRSKI